MLVLQGWPLCEDVAPLTPEELMEQEIIEAEYHERRQGRKRAKT